MKIMVDKTIILPKKLIANSLHEIIGKFNFIFKSQNKLSPNFCLDLEKINDVDIIGMLILYKFIEYSVEKKCFTNPTIKKNNDPLNKFIKQFGFEDYINAYLKGKNADKAINKALKNLKIEKTNSFLIAPQVLERGNIQSKKGFDINFKAELDTFYGLSSKTLIEAILICGVEISSNFYNHATNETKTLILARGSKHFIEIACADTAGGLLNTLRDIEKYKSLNEMKLIKEAFKQGVTSKPDSNHMGYGLWFINEIVKKYNGFLEVYSSNSNFSSKFGKERVNKSPYWKGTIIYLKLPVKNGIDIGDILIEKREKNDLLININFT